MKTIVRLKSSQIFQNALWFSFLCNETLLHVFLIRILNLENRLARQIRLN